MLGFFVVVVALMLAGEVVADAVAPILPGPLVGMVLLLALFALRGGVPVSFEAPAAGFMSYLALFVLPASLGIVEEWRRLEGVWLRFGLVLLGASLLTAVVTALVAGALFRGRDDDATEPPQRRPAPARRERDGR